MAASPVERRVLFRYRSGRGALIAPAEVASISLASLPLALLSLGQVLLGLARLLRGHRDDLGRLRDLVLVLDHEVQERLHLRLPDRLLRRVHEQRPGQWLVAA